MRGLGRDYAGRCVFTLLMEFAGLQGQIEPPSYPLSLSLSLSSLFLLLRLFLPACVQVVDLEVDESSFTGETIPSRKSTLPQVRMCIRQGLKTKANQTSIYTKTPRTTLFPRKI